MPLETCIPASRVRSRALSRFPHAAYIARKMERCVICLESFDARRCARYCENCNHPLGHPKCIQQLFLEEVPTCPLCNKGRLEKTTTRIQSRDNEWYDGIISLGNCESPLQYLHEFSCIVTEMIQTKNITHYSTPKRLLLIFDDLLDDIIPAILAHGKFYYQTFRAVEILVFQMTTLARIFRNK